MSEADRDISEDIVAAVRAAAAAGTPLSIEGSGSKRFMGRAVQAEPLATSAHRGILGYAPTELTLTARAGTPLAEIRQALAGNGQYLPFDPPAFGENATLGGTIACGLSGPRRPYAGAARDYVLGTRIVNGSGELLRFGGEVMKNVAGYDLSRLMTGAMGTLGVLLDISLKVLPEPGAQRTLSFELSAQEAIRRANEWAARPLPLTAVAHVDGRMLVRLSATAGGVEHAARMLGGEPLADDDDFWRDWREHRHAFFAGDAPLWRLSVPATSAPLELSGESAIDWGGALRWLRSDLPAETIRALTGGVGGHATLLRAGPAGNETPFHPLPEGLHRLHQRLKASLDPQRVLNRGRMYADL